MDDLRLQGAAQVADGASFTEVIARGQSDFVHGYVGVCECSHERVFRLVKQHRSYRDVVSAPTMADRQRFNYALRAAHWGGRGHMQNLQ
jgi:hypothetical protein